MKRIILFVLLFAALKVAGQTTGYLRFDTVRIMKQNGTCELYIINKTKDSLGVLTNVGGGLTSFKKPRKLNDSTFTVGNDTLIIPGSGGNQNIQQVLNNGSTLTENETITIADSLRAISGLFVVDSLRLNATTTVTDTTTHKPLVYNTSTKKAYFFDRWLGGGGSSQTIQQTLDLGDTTNRRIYWHSLNDTTTGVFSYAYVPTNINTAYTSHGIAMGFSGGWQRFNGVNVSPRPNVVATILGYNHHLGGGVVNAGEAAFGFRAETHFEPNGSQDLFEFHLPELTSYSGVIKRPFSMYVDKATNITQLNYLATGGVNYQDVNGLDLFSFNSSGNYSFVGHGSGSQFTVYDESLAGNRYQLQVEGTDVYHNSFGNLQRFDGPIYTDDQTTNNPHIYVHDPRNTNNLSSIFMDLTSTNAKRPINITAACNGGIESFHANTTGSSIFNISSTTGLARQTLSGISANQLITGNNTTGSTYISISNTSATNPSGSGYNFGAVSLQAGNGAIGGELVANFGQGAETRYANTGLVLGTFTDHPVLFNMGVAGTERMRLTHSGELFINSSTDQGAFTLQNTGGLYQNGTFHLRGTLAGNNTMKVLVKGTDSVVYQIDASSLGGSQTLQQVLTNGSTLTTDNTIVNGTNQFDITGSRNFASGYTFGVTNTTGTTGVAIKGIAADGRGVWGTATSGQALYGNATSGNGVFSLATTGNSIYAESTSGLAIEAVVNPSSTNTVVPMISLTRPTTGTAANGIGQSLQFYTKTIGGTNDSSAFIEVSYTDAATATATSKLVFKLSDNALLGEKFTIAGSGQITGHAYGAGTFTGTPTATLQTTSAGAIIEGPLLSAGTYTPTLTNGTNVTGSSAYQCQYSRVGNVVTVSGKVDIDPTATGDLELGLSLPVASNIANEQNAGGTITCGDAQGLSGAIKGDATNDRASIIIDVASSASFSYFFTFTYLVL